MTTKNPSVGPIPSQREIKQCCQRIQANWSPVERFRRTIRHRHLWPVPLARIDLGLKLAEERNQLLPFFVQIVLQRKDFP